MNIRSAKIILCFIVCISVFLSSANAEDEPTSKPVDETAIVAPAVDLKEIAPPPKAIEHQEMPSIEESVEASTEDKESIDNADSVLVEDAVESQPVAESTAVAPAVDLKEVAPPPQAIEGQETLSKQEPVEESADKNDSVATITTTPESENADKFVILGSEVKPATATRLAWSPKVGLSGLDLSTPVLVINGKRPGKTLCMTGAIHGDELNSIEIIRRVMYDIDPKKLRGKIIGVPIVNLQGFQRASRYLPDRRDLNRYFPGDAEGSLASRIAHSLFSEVIKHCHALVDVHTGSHRRTNLPQLRANMLNSKVAKFTEGFDEIAVVHSKGSKGMLRVAALDDGITAVTLEVGEATRLQDSEVKKGVKGINALLEREDMYSRFFTWGDPEPVYYQSRWMRASRGGILFNSVKLGDRVDKGDVLGTITDPITNEETIIRAKEDGRIIGMAVNQVVMSGFATYHIGIRASEESMIEAAEKEIQIQKAEPNFDKDAIDNMDNE